MTGKTFERIAKEMSGPGIISRVAADAPGILKNGRRDQAWMGAVDLKKQTLWLALGNKETISVPFSVITDSPSGLCMTAKDAKPNFELFDIADWGWGLLFGRDFDCGVDTTVMEYDFLTAPGKFEARWEKTLREIGNNGKVGHQAMSNFRERLAMQKARLKRRA